MMMFASQEESFSDAHSLTHSANRSVTARIMASSISPVRKKVRPMQSLVQQSFDSSQVMGLQTLSGWRERQTVLPDSFVPASGLFSQDSNAFSQLSQDFADRLGQMNVRSQDATGSDDSALSYCERLPPPAPRAPKPIKVPAPSTVPDSQRQIDIRPVRRNPFLCPSHHVEHYIALATTGSKPHSKAPKKLWVSAFKPASRYLTDFEEICALGKGHFSQVFCVRHRLDGSLYAVKKVKSKTNSDNELRMQLREPSAFAVLCDCPNLVRYYGCWLEDSCLYLQFELCALGTLEDLIATEAPALSAMHVLKSSPYKAGDDITVSRGIWEPVAWLVLQELASTLDFMHRMNMVHLDIRPANVFITVASDYTEPTSPIFQSVISAPPLGHNATVVTNAVEPVRDRIEGCLLRKQYLLRVGDLGHARRLDETMQVNEGETRYCPRELINSESNALDLRKADVFSLGASVYELCLGRFLGASGDDGIREWHSIRDGDLQPDFYSAYSPQLSQLIAQMLSADPQRRPSISHIMAQATKAVATNANCRSL